jgi:glycosyltransferase involved in cell wall biosynthesis
VALTRFEAGLLTSIYGTDPHKVHVVPNGVENIFLESAPVERGPWLVCTATITERKRVLELARAAVKSEVPVWIVGKPYSENDPYARQFISLANAHPKLVRFEGPVEDRVRLAQIYRAARGFVLLSSKESLSLSALEAAACECPLLLSDLPWARDSFSGDAQYCPIAGTAETARALRQFYESAPMLKPPPKPANWHSIGAQFKQLYDTLCNASR